MTEFSSPTEVSDAENAEFVRTDLPADQRQYLQVLEAKYQKLMDKLEPFLGKLLASGLVIDQERMLIILGAVSITIESVLPRELGREKSNGVFFEIDLTDNICEGIWLNCINSQIVSITGVTHSAACLISDLDGEQADTFLAVLIDHMKSAEAQAVIFPAFTVESNSDNKLLLRWGK